MVLFSVYLAAIVAFAGELTPVAQLLGFCTVLFAFGHGVLAYGRRGICTFLIACLVITFASENLSILTGFPFGHYHFEIGAAFPHVGVVPAIVGFLYFAMGYCSWMIAALLLDKADLHLDRPFNVICLPLVAAFIMVQWDVVIDPANATLARAWIWHEGGGYFGVPLSNYLGWYLTVWLFFQIFSFALYKQWCKPRRLSHPLWLAPLLLYLAVALSDILPYLSGQSGEVTDASGHIWKIHDIRETTVIVALSTMVFTSILGLLRWAMQRDGLKREI